MRARGVDARRSSVVVATRIFAHVRGHLVDVRGICGGRAGARLRPYRGDLRRDGRLAVGTGVATVARRPRMATLIAARRWQRERRHLRRGAALRGEVGARRWRYADHDPHPPRAHQRADHLIDFVGERTYNASPARSDVWREAMLGGLAELEREQAEAKKKRR